MTKVNLGEKPDTPPPNPDEPWIWLNGQWYLVATDTSDGVPDKLEFPAPEPSTEEQS